MKPLIGITTKYTEDDSIGIQAHMGTMNQEWHLLANDYINAVELAGGLPVIIPLYNNLENACEIIKKLDGLLLTGGNDVDPQHYGEIVSDEVGSINPRLDELEINLVKKVVKDTNIPILGICRGHQVLNVALGGSLFQDLKKNGMRDHFKHNSPKYHPIHEVKIIPDTKLYSALAKEDIKVNSFHHQSVKALAPSLVASAISDDGLVEAVELKGDRFVLGLQWHPEMMSEVNDDQLNIFKYFVMQCI